MPEFDRRKPAHETIWTVVEVSFEHECAALIAEFERLGFEEALITTSRGMVILDFSPRYCTVSSIAFDAACPTNKSAGRATGEVPMPCARSKPHMR